MAGLNYQRKTVLKTIAKVVLIVISAFMLFSAIRFFYLERYLVYDENGAHFDRSGETLTTPQQEQAKPTGEFRLISESPKEEIAPQEETPKIRGVYLTTEQLTDEAIRAQYETLPEGSNTVLLDVRTLTGLALYPTQLGEEANADTEGVARFIEGLSRRCSTVARIPAYRDRAFSLEDYANALPISGGALWMDWNGSYCLDPAKDAVREYMIAEAEELAAIGFREVIFDGFDFPQSQNIVYDGDGQQAAREAAAVIADALASKNIAVSFGSSDPEILKYSAHAWITADGGELVSSLARDYGAALPDGESALVFLTASKDTRFADYGVLTPPDVE